MRHLEQILKDKEENDATLAKAEKRREELLIELETLAQAVNTALKN